jgi:CubicO group peptidase (beta-lactamase class C family)
MRLAAVLLSAAALFPPGSRLQARTDPVTTGSLSAGQIESIDALVSSEMARQHIPGLAIGIYKRGHVLLAKGYGLANIELSAPVRPETVFQSGSVGKQFVSAATMMLVEEHKLSLDDSIARYFPGSPPAWKPILLKHLLSHTSGLAEYESDERVGPRGDFYLRLDFTDDELLRKIEALPIEWRPGEKWAYRNTNYLLLGFVIQAVSGKPYAEYLQERIFKPLSMTATRLISERDIIPNRSSGYELDAGTIKNQQWVSPTFNSTADGALYFNVLDLARWDEALYTTRLLAQSSLDRMWTVYRLDDGRPNWAGYGFGWFIDRQNGHRVLAHGGAWQGFTCQISRYPEDSLSVAVLTNLDSDHSDPQVIAEVVAGLVAPPLMPQKFAPIKDSKPEVASVVRARLDRLIAGEDIRPTPAAELLASLPFEERSALIPEEPLQTLQKRLATTWPGGSLTLVRRARLSDASPAQQEMSVYRLAKDDAALLVLFMPGTQGSTSAFGVMGDRPYE